MNVIKLLTCVLFIKFVITPTFLYSQEQDWKYADYFGGVYGNSPNGSNNQPNNLVTDNEGNAYIFGTYGALTEIGGDILPHFNDENRGSFIVKYDCRGEVEWSKAISNSQRHNNQASYMIIKDDYLYIMGSCRIDEYYDTWFLDTLVDGEELYQDYINNNSTYPWVSYNDYTYLIKMDLDGNIQDTNLFSLHRNDMIISNLWHDPNQQRAFAIDNENSFYIPVRLSSDRTAMLNYNNEFITEEMTSVEYIPGYSHYIFKFDSDFNLLWSKPFFSGVSDPDLYGIDFSLYDIKCDDNNNLYIVGNLYAYDEENEDAFPIEFNFDSGQSLVSYQHNNSIGFLIKMNSNGEVVWTQQSRSFGNDGYSQCVFESVVLDEESGNLYVSGTASQLVDWLPDAGTIFGDDDILSSHYNDANAITGFIANYDTEGNYKWVKTPVAKGCIIGSLDVYDN